MHGLVRLAAVVAVVLLYAKVHLLIVAERETSPYTQNIIGTFFVYLVLPLVVAMLVFTAVFLMVVVVVWVAEGFRK